jgi:hypothetical protein
MVACEGIASPSGREIDGKYPDQNEKDLVDRYKQFQKEWDIFVVTLMCDSWTGPTRMSVIIFLIYVMGSRGSTSPLMRLVNLRIPNFCSR